MRHFTISAILKHIFVCSILNLLEERSVLYFLLLLRLLRLKISIVVELRECASDGPKSDVLALVFGLDETASRNRKQKHVDFHFSLKFFELAKPGSLEIEFQYDGYPVTGH